MASSKNFMFFVYDQVANASDDVTYRKMFGDYMLFCNRRPVLLICDDTVYVKQLPETLSIFNQYGITPDSGTPFKGARPHYILDIENSELSIDMVRLLSQILPIPKKSAKMPNKINDTDIDKLPGTDFQHDVWKALIKIPYGETRTYSQIAKMSGHPNAVRAVANAIGKNPLPPVIPCHRVIRNDGKIGGYSAPGGIEQKKKLLNKEKCDA